MDDDIKSQQQQQPENEAAGNTNYDLNSNFVSSKPWYFSGGKQCPKPAKKYRKTKKRVAKLHPFEEPTSDRITNQLMFVPPNYEQIKESGKYKQILLYNGLGTWNMKAGKDIFKRMRCPVNRCKLTANREIANHADLILYKDYYIPTDAPRSPRQLFMMFFLESPYHTQHIKFPDVFNWTATYRYEKKKSLNS